MKLLKHSLSIFVILCITYATSVEYTMENCKCRDNYEVQRNSAGKVECVGKLLDHIHPCNEPQAPRCVCTQHKVTGIMTDADGTWCTTADKAVTKWPCENKDEWENYTVQLDAYEKSLKQ